MFNRCSAIAAETATVKLEDLRREEHLCLVKFKVIANYCVADSLL
jgi:hypothetical protein